MEGSPIRWKPCGSSMSTPILLRSLVSLFPFCFLDMTAFLGNNPQSRWKWDIYVLWFENMTYTSNRTPLPPSSEGRSLSPRWLPALQEKWWGWKSRPDKCEPWFQKRWVTSLEFFCFCFCFFFSHVLLFDIWFVPFPDLQLQSRYISSTVDAGYHKALFPVNFEQLSWVFLFNGM